MRNKIAAAVWVFAVGVVLLMPGRTLADSANLSILSPLTVSQGSSAAVDVNIAGVTDLYDFQLDLTFNPAVLEATGVTEGSFLSGGGATFFLSGFIDNTAGSVTFNADTLLGLVPGASGNGTLLEFDFTALEAGTSALDLANVILQDSNGNEIPSSLSGSSVNVTGTGSVPVPEPGVLTLFGVALGSLAILRARRRT
jgi:hypothetical protein